MRPSVTAALMQALFQEWAETGYGALSLENVAKRAGAGKAALYRRWPSKLAMVIDSLGKVGMDVAVPETPDAGSLEGDLRAWLAGMRDLLNRRVVRRILPDLQAEMLRSPELADAIRGQLQDGYASNASVILDRAIRRGEISKGVDKDLAMNALMSMLYWRLIIRSEPADNKYIDRLTRFLAAALRAQ